MENLKLFTIEEAAKICRVSTRQIFRYIESKKLKVVRLSAQVIRVSENDLKDFISKHKK
jgi:excisionase family DNA binding protein